MPMLQLMPTTQEALIVDIVKETPELLQAGVHDAVPHNDLCAMNPRNCKISVPEDRKFFFFRGKGAQAKKSKLRERSKKQLEPSGVTHVERGSNTGYPGLQRGVLPLDHNC